MEHKSIEGVAVKASPAGTAEVVIAELNVIDLDGDVVARGAIGSQTVPILPAHNWGSIPLGKARTRELGDRVIADLIFNLDVPEAKAWHSALMFDVEHGPAVQEYSWAYNPTKARPATVDDRRVRLLEEVKLREVSMVIQGASIGSHTVGVKCTDCAGRGDSFDSPVLRRELTRAKALLDAQEADAMATLQALYDQYQHASLDYEHERYKATTAHDQTTRILRAWTSCFYTAVDHPDPVLARAGQACLEMCAAELGIDPPPLTWMVPESAKERSYAERYMRDWDHLELDARVYGAYHLATGRVWVRADLGFEKTMQYVAHEVRHAAGGDEDEARAYQAQWAARLPHADVRSR